MLCGAQICDVSRRSGVLRSVRYPLFNRNPAPRFVPRFFDWTAATPRPRVENQALPFRPCRLPFRASQSCVVSRALRQVGVRPLPASDEWHAPFRSPGPRRCCAVRGLRRRSANRSHHHRRRNRRAGSPALNPPALVPFSREPGPPGGARGARTPSSALCVWCAWRRCRPLVTDPRTNEHDFCCNPSV